MEEFKGTKEDWFIDQDYSNESETTIVSKTHRVANVKHYNNKIVEHLIEPTKEQGRANAQLIAAAPNLLEALQEMHEAINVYASMYGVGKLTPKLLKANDKSEKAIKKALGE